MFSGAHNFNISDATFNASGRDINTLNYYYLSSDEESKLKEWLAAPDYSIHFTTAFNKRVDGTGQWIFKDSTYLEWKENAGILWIQGKAGSGKTVLIRKHHHFEWKNCWTVFMSSNDKVDEDIATYVENQLQYVFEIINHATLKDEIKAILMEKADGGFRYIDCQLQTLGNCATAAMVKKKSTLLPSNLQQTYAEAIEKSKKDNHAQETHHILLWLLYSFQPLHLEQVAIICSFDLKASEVDCDAEMLGGLEKIISTTLVTIDQDQVVQLAHASVKEYLLENHDDAGELIEINAHLAHNIIAQMCIIYLLQQDVQQQGVYHKIWIPTLYEYMRNITTFEQYATQYWAEHSQYNEMAEISSKGYIGFSIETALGHAIQLAALKGFKDVIELFIEYGADVNALGEEYGSALQAAAYGGERDIVEILIKHGANIDAQGGTYGSALQAAACWSQTAIVEILLAHDINAQGGEYGSALQAAAYRGQTAIVEILLAHGADINAKGGEYGSAL
ncbi:hypothetical protein FB446DRAFT_701867 [Lentinula raphanica]|nr:hypothetical protein FB446DRAFT_701867 [Lentinula raphanica]